MDKHLIRDVLDWIAMLGLSVGAFILLMGMMFVATIFVIGL